MERFGDEIEEDGVMTPTMDGAKTPVMDGMKTPVNFVPCPIIQKHGWRERIRNFTPGWFAMVMGTGICSTLVNNIPYTNPPDGGRWLFYVSVAFWCLNLCLFCLFCIITVIRFIMFPEIFGAMIRNPNHTIFLGTFPMALAVIENMMIFACHGNWMQWGDWIVYLAWACWWVDAFVSAAVCFLVPFLIMTNGRINHLSHMTAAWILPIVPSVVASNSGAVIASQLPNPYHALTTVIFCYVLWGICIPMSFIVITIYFHRCAVHKLPPKEAMATVFFPIGPTGIGISAIQLLGKDARAIFPQVSELGSMAGEILYVVGFLTALLIWGFAFAWLVYAVAAVCMTRRFPFNMGWWTFVFPFGAYTTGTMQLGKELPSDFFKILSIIWTVCTILAWGFVFVSTIRGLFNGTALVDPLLRDLEPSMTLEKEHDSSKEV